MTNKKDNNAAVSGLIKFGVLCFCIGIVLAGTFMLGEYNSCRMGGGSLNGHACVDIEVVGACIHNDQLYIPPEGGLNTTLTK